MSAEWTYDPVVGFINTATGELVEDSASAPSLPVVKPMAPSSTGKPLEGKIDAQGLYHTPEGDVYRHTRGGGWIMMQHGSRRMRELGTFDVR